MIVIRKEYLGPWSVNIEVKAVRVPRWRDIVDVNNNNILEHADRRDV
jgi:hypothetical protein